LDTFTHALSGALIARATAATDGAIPLSRRIVLGTAAAAFPDSDIVLSLGSPIAYLLYHRGLTHSLLVLPAWAILLAWLAARLWRDPRGWRPYFAVAAMGVGIHIAGDVITSFGTMVFAPLSDLRVAMGTTFIIDLYFTGIIVVGLLTSRLWRASRAPAVLALSVLVCYVGFQAVLHRRAIEAAREYARAHQLFAARVAALERPLSPFNWRLVVGRGDEQHYADVNLLATTPPEPPGRDAGLIARISSTFAPVGMAHWISAPRFGDTADDRRVAREAWQQPSFGFFRWFASYPALYKIDRGNPSICVWFQDLRFALPGRGATPFRYGMCRDGDGPWRPNLLGASDERKRLD